MAYGNWLAHEVLNVVRANRFWMTWNLILAFIPAVLATGLFWRPHRRGAVWWMGVGVFVLFLPNAPYVITDLIHLRLDVATAASDGVVVFGVLPLYALFVVLGFTSYLFCLELMVREVRSVRPDTARWMVELPTHAICSLGIVLGRIARLNSWDTVSHPRWTAETIFNTITWRGAPFALVAVFIAVWLTSAVLRAIYLAIGTTGRRAFRRVRPARPPSTAAGAAPGPAGSGPPGTF